MGRGATLIKALTTFCCVVALACPLCACKAEQVASLETPFSTSSLMSLVQEAYVSLDTTVVPSSYDLRDVDGASYVGAAKDQGVYGTCWAFAAIAAAESSLVKDGLSSADVDLSEVQLAYFAYHDPVDDFGGTEGDYIEDTSDLGWLDVGGDAYLASVLFSDRIGVADENGVGVTYNAVRPSTQLDDSFATGADVAQLSNCYWIDMEEPIRVKRMIMEYGGCVTGYAGGTWDGSYREIDGIYTYYNPDSSAVADHESVIIGWDDSYPAENFGTTPPGPGAWLVKQSFGTGDGWSDDGCFWLSYYDATNDGYAVFFDFDAPGTYDNLLYHDGGCMLSDVSYGEESWMASVYTAPSAMSLRAFALYMDNNDALTYEAFVYETPTDATDPTSGTLIARQRGSLFSEGYHTVDLKTPVTLDAGSAFSIVVRLYGSPDGIVSIPIDPDYEYVQPGGAPWYYSHANCAPGTSFVSENGKDWLDQSGSGGADVRLRALTDNL